MTRTRYDFLGNLISVLKGDRLRATAITSVYPGPLFLRATILIFYLSLYTLGYSYSYMYMGVSLLFSWSGIYRRMNIHLLMLLLLSVDSPGDVYYVLFHTPTGIGEWKMWRSSRLQVDVYMWETDLAVKLLKQQCFTFVLPAALQAGWLVDNTCRGPLCCLSIIVFWQSKCHSAGWLSVCLKLCHGLVGCPVCFCHIDKLMLMDLSLLHGKQMWLTYAMICIICCAVSSLGQNKSLWFSTYMYMCAPWMASNFAHKAALLDTNEVF